MELLDIGKHTVKVLVLPYHPDRILVQLPDGRFQCYGIERFISLMVERMLIADGGTVTS